MPRVKPEHDPDPPDARNLWNLRAESWRPAYRLPAASGRSSDITSCSSRGPHQHRIASLQRTRLELDIGSISGVLLERFLSRRARVNGRFLDQRHPERGADVAATRRMSRPGRRAWALSAPAPPVPVRGALALGSEKNGAAGGRAPSSARPSVHAVCSRNPAD